MTENDDFTHVQRRLCAVIAKSEWTSSRMRMQKSGEELRESRARSNRTANQFLQDLLEKRTDADLIDDNGAVDRYNKFVKYKSKTNDDSSETLDEFERRLRALNANRQNQLKKQLNNENSLNIQEKKATVQLNNQMIIEEKQILKPVANKEKLKSSRILPTLSSINPITSTPNESLSSVFPIEDIQEISHVESIASEKNQTLNLSTSPILHTPKFSIEHIQTSIVHSQSSSDIRLYHQCHFPRSLTSRGKQLTNRSPSKRQLPITPSVQSIEQKQQFFPEKIYDLLDHLDDRMHGNFTRKLEELTLTNVISQIESENSTQIDTDEENIVENETILPDFFSQTIPIEQEKRFYSIHTFHIPNSEDLSLYTMTFSTVQLTGSLLLPYSILNGRRPFLKCSNETNFKQILSKKRMNSTYQVTAIEYSFDNPDIQQNDIILKIDDQSVWGLTLNSISDLLKQSPSCSLTLVRLGQPIL